MQKGIRKSGNVAKDIYNTYVKQNKDSKIKKENTQGEDMIDVQLNDNNEANEKVTNEETQQYSVEDLVDEVVKLNAKIEELTKEKDELKDQLIRKAAEFENYKKRTQKEKELLIFFGNAELLTKFLTLFDNIEKAVESSQKTQDFEALLKGLELIYKQSQKLLEEEGVKPIEDKVGDDFNLDLHEAIMSLDSDLPPGKIVQVFQKGYMYKDKVLRHSKVATSKED
ncbi:MAG: nucleotide exchange factor GrpE [Candidatus Kapaibacteriota bacterium]